MTDTKIIWHGPDGLKKLLVPLADLEPFPGNPRRGDIGSLRESLQRFGQVLPALVDPTLGEDGRKRIVARHHLVLAALAEGWTHIAAVENSFENEDEARVYLNADNILGQIGSYDEQQLAEQLIWLGEQESLAGVGYDSDELAAALKALGEYVPQLPDPGDADTEETGAYFAIVVEVATEDDQVALLERLEGEGFSCRLLMS